MADLSFTLEEEERFKYTLDNDASYSSFTPAYSSQAVAKEKGVKVEIASGKDRAEVTDRLSRGDSTVLTEASGKAREGKMSVEDTFNMSVMTGDVNIKDVLLSRIKKEELFDGQGDDFYLSPSLILDNPEYNGSLATLIKNSEIMQERMIKEIEDANGTVIGDVVDFVDWGLLRGALFGIFEDATRRKERKGEDMLSTLLSVDFEKNPELLDEIVDEYKREGIFTSNNLFALLNGLDESTAAGYDRWADFTQALSLYDVAGITAVGAKGAVRALRAADPIQIVSALKGQKAAGQAMKDIFKPGGALNDDDGSLTRHLSTDAYDPSNYEVARPSNGVAQKIHEENSIVEAMLEADSRGLFGRDVPIEEVKAKATKVAKDISDNMGFPLNNMKVTPIHTGFGGWRVRVDIGKVSDGSAFKTEAAAKGRATKLGPEAEVVQLEDGTGWIVRVERDFSTSSLSPKASVDGNNLDVARDLFGRLFGASGEREELRIAQLRNLGEAGLSHLRDIIQPSLNKFLAVSGKERESINKVLTVVRDGDPVRGIKPKAQYFDKDEFITEYKLINDGEAPSKKVIDAYFAMVDLSDADWYIRASRARKSYVDLGYRRLMLDGSTRKGRVVSSLPNNAKVYDVKTGKYLTPDEISKTDVWHLTDGFGPNKDMFVANPNGVRTLRLSDVMDYNAGGTRLRPDANYFVGSVNDTKTGTKRFKALLYSFSSRDSAEAVTSLNEIVKIVRRGLRNQGVEELKDLAGTQYASEISRLLGGNKWNVDIEDFDDLVRLSDETGHKFDNFFAAKGRDERLTEFGDDLAKSNMSVGESVDLEVNNKRTSKGIMEYGSSSKGNVSDPSQALATQMSASAFYLANRAYTQNAVVGWVKAAQASNLIKFPSGIHKGDYYSLFQSIKVEDIPRTSNVGRRLAEMKEITERRLNAPTRTSRMWEEFGVKVQEFIFDKSSLKFNIKDKDAGAGLLKVGFFSKFGFFNVAQLFMQGFHVTSIAAISPLGVKGAGAAIPMNILMSLPKDSDLYKLALKRLAKFDADNGSDLAELVEFYRETGRWHTGSDVPELQGSSSIIPSSVNKVNRTAGNLMNFGLAPFTQGERLSRSTAVATAFYEFKARFPDVAISSDFAKSWISAREQRLTFNMTTSNKAKLFSGPMRVPTQWLTYTFRAMEAVFVGRGFTPAERARLAFVLGPMFGLTGFGLGGFTEDLLDLATDNPTDSQYLWLKYGMMDGFARAIIGEDTTFSSRLAPVDGLVDTLEKLYSEQFMTVMFGPSSEITGDIVKNTYQAIGNLVSGNFEMTKQDIAAAMQNISTFNNMQKALGIWHYGELRSRDGSVIPGTFSEEDGWLQLFGFSPTEVEETYNNNYMLIKDKKKVDALRKELTVYARNGIMLMKSENEDEVNRGIKMFEEISAIIEASPIAPSEKVRVRRGILEDNAYRLADLNMRLLKGGHATLGTVFERFTKEEEE